MTWKAVPKNYSGGVIKAYGVKIEGRSNRHGYVYTCSNSFNIVIQGLEKAKVYKLSIAGYTSKGRGNVSEYMTVQTNIGGKL